jgi:hypothetical protein
MYVIVQTSRLNKNDLLVLANKEKTNKWWTSILEDALIINTKQQAIEIVSKLQYNNPRVIPYDIAKKEIKPIVTKQVFIRHKTKYKTKNIFEMNDYEYKEWLGYSDAIEQGGGMFE